MAEETKRDTLKVSMTLDEDRVIELIDDYIAGNLLEKVVHCIDCKWRYMDKWCLHFAYHEGEAGAKTPYETMHKLINEYTIKCTSLGGEYFRGARGWLNI